MYHANVGEIISQNKCHLEYDESLQTHVLDEDKLLDILETKFDASSGDDSDDDDSDDDDSNRGGDDNGNNGNGGNGNKKVGGKYGNIVTDYHACEMFPERWFDLVIVLRVDTHVLYDRLMQRGYSENKRSQNMQCEIMQVVLDEAQESYAKEIVVELKSNTIQDMDQNVDRVVTWYNQWIADHNSS